MKKTVKKKKNWSGLNILSGTENFSSALTLGITVKNGKKEMWESYDSLHGSEYLSC